MSSFDNTFEPAIVIVGVVKLGVAAGDDTARAAVVRPRRGHGVLAVVPGWSDRQPALAVGEHTPILWIGKRTAHLDRAQRYERLRWKLRDRNRCVRRLRPEPRGSCLSHIGGNADQHRQQPHLRSQKFAKAGRRGLLASKVSPEPSISSCSEHCDRVIFNFFCSRVACVLRLRCGNRAYPAANRFWLATSNSSLFWWSYRRTVGDALGRRHTLCGRRPFQQR